MSVVYHVRFGFSTDARLSQEQLEQAWANMVKVLEQVGAEHISLVEFDEAA